MANKENVGDHNPTFSKKGKRAHFDNPISSDVDTNPERYELVETFQHKPGINDDLANEDEAIRMIANRNFELLGTGATTDDCTFSATVAGILLTTDTSADQQVVVAPHLDTGLTAWTQTKWGTENQVIWEAVVRTDASVASIILWGGLKLTFDQDITADNTQCFFRFDAGVANWEAVYTLSNDGDVQVDTGVVVAVNTNYYLRIELDSSRVAHFFINDKEVAISSGALANDVDLIPYVGVEGNAKLLTLVKQKISRKVFE